MERAKDLDSVTAERDRQRALYESLRKQRLECFVQGFSQITMKLKVVAHFNIYININIYIFVIRGGK